MRTGAGKKIKGRYNTYTGRVELGYTLATLEGIINFVNSPKWSTLSHQNKVGFMFTASSWLIKTMIGLSIKMIFFNTGEDDEDVIFNYDPNDKEIINQLKYASSPPVEYLLNVKRKGSIETGDGTFVTNTFDVADYAKLQLLRLQLGIQTEYETFEPTSSYKVVKGMLTGQSPIFTGPVKQIEDLFKAASSDDVYDRDAGPLVWQEKDSGKVLNILAKLAGFNGKLIDPAYGIERETSQKNK
jgi:hypothetical protein